MALRSREPVLGEAPPDSNVSWRWHQHHQVAQRRCSRELSKDGAGGDPFDFQLEVSYEDETEIEVVRGTEDEEGEDVVKCEETVEEGTSPSKRDSACEEAGDVEEMDQVLLEDVRFLLDRFSKTSYRAKCETKEDGDILHKCLVLFSNDYHLSVINNSGGELSSHYPSQIIILEYEKSSRLSGHTVKTAAEEDSLYQSLYEPAKLLDVCQKARLARCRARFPVPVILLDGKRVCRSSTLSGGPEIYGRSSYDFFFSGKSGTAREGDEDEEEEDLQDPPSSSDWQLFDRVRSQDIKLLKAFNVTHICDLMVEKKKVKFGMNITSSEKVDKENRYSDFTILSLPYPGCEFFQEYSSNSYSGHGLIYAWNQAFVDARLVIPSDSLNFHLDIDWSSYKSWDVIRLTQNYLKLLLKYIKSGTGGLLVHCISGWDRTPLFVSLLRLSLWADGEVHRSLKPLEILYLTLAYDWFLFGHNLADRLGKREEILFFCFDVLKYIATDEYAVRKTRHHRSRKMSEMDPLLDDLLIDSGNVRGSNTSLNSSCSSVSTQSQEGPPLFFLTNSCDPLDEAIVAPAATTGECTWSRQVRPEEMSSALRSSTTPVAVPVLHSAKRSDSSSSCGCGSWQIISGTGSLRGSTSTRDSVSSQTPSSDHSAHSRHSRCSTGWCDLQDSEGGVQQRRTKKSLPSRAGQLNEVRKAFINVYQSSNFVRYRNGPDAGFGSATGGGSGSSVGSGGLSSLLDHFAEKVGIRTGRGTQ